LESFDFYVEHRPTEELYKVCIERYQAIGAEPDERLRSIKQLRSLACKLSGFTPKEIDCCINTCVAFTGYLKNMDKCPVCGEPRLDEKQKWRNTFSYLPLIPQLCALYTSPDIAKKMRYLHQYQNPENSISDIFDGDRYKELRRKNVIVEGHTQPYKYFEDEHQIALGLSADGMCPFKRWTNSCWPLLIINYNLPPDECTHVNNLICIGMVPGPGCPADLNSYLQPLIDELLELSQGTAAVDVSQQKLFALQAHLIAVFGNIPAVTKILKFIGHNSCFPCCFCLIPTVPGVTSKGGTHRYCPLHQPDGFQTNPLNLVLQNHKDCLKVGLDALQALNDTTRNKMASKTGIKGVSLLTRVPSISVPSSFPIDLMHMIWLNLVPQLVEMWTGKFNQLDDGLESYQLSKSIWNAIGNACKESGPMIPSSFGCKVPHLKKTGEFIAETWNNFTMLLAPNLLRQRFADQRYYQHFVRLVSLLHLIISFNLPCEEIPNIRLGLAEWIEEFEQYVYFH
jgi:hypothetical protein